jgi:para-nitrobenzyl esterase
MAEPCPPFLKNGGAVHSSELNYLFPKLSNTKAIDAPDLAPESQALANQMVTYWSKFAYTGSPNAAGLPEWPTYRGGTERFGGDSVMLLAPNNVKAYNADNEHSCSSFWQVQYPSQLPSLSQ